MEKEMKEDKASFEDKKEIPKEEKKKYKEQLKEKEKCQTGRK